MKAKPLSVAMAIASCAWMVTAFADATATVKILAPAEGATLDAMAQNKIAYEVSAGPSGDHIHLYIDDDEAALLRQLKGTYSLESLSPGSHRLCIKVVNKNHTPIGAESCVKVKVE